MGPRIRDPMKRFCFERIWAVLHNSLLIKMLLHPPQGLEGSYLLSSAIESSSQSSEPFFFFFFGYINFCSSPIQREQDPLCYPNSFLRRLRPSWRSLVWPLPRQTSPRKTAPPHPSTQSATGMSRTSGAPVSEAATAMVTVSWTVAATPTNSISTAWRSHAGTRYDFYIPVYSKEHSINEYHKPMLTILSSPRSTPANTSSSCSSTSPSAPAPKSQSPSGHPQTTRQTAAPAI